MSNPLDNVLKEVEDAKENVDVDENIFTRMKTPEKTVEVSLPVMMDTGKVEIFKGYRCQFDGAAGPYKGGIRYHPKVSEEEVKALSARMVFKNATANLPYGGAKGGIICDPTELSRKEKQALTRRYTQKIKNIIGPRRDVPGPDMGTDEQVMSWIMDTFSVDKGYTVPGVVTGKPPHLGGTLGRKRATGSGIRFVIEEMMNYMDESVKDLDVAIQGFGSVGRVSAEELNKIGMNIVAVSDSGGGIRNKEGLNLEDVKRVKDETGEVTNYKEVEHISNEELLKLNVDILIPAAIGDVITEENAEEIQASYVVEGANGPTTPKADRIMNNNGCFVVPDILANSGGVSVSYLEWVQNFQHFKWSLERVRNRLEKRMKESFREVAKKMNDIETNSMREAAYTRSIEKIHKAHKYRGLHPK